MFKRAEFLLTHPICRCQEQNLAWGVTHGSNLKLSCRSCGVYLLVTKREFQARIVCEIPYPADLPDQPDVEPARE